MGAAAGAAARPAQVVMRRGKRFLQHRWRRRLFRRRVERTIAEALSGKTSPLRREELWAAILRD